MLHKAICYSIYPIENKVNHVIKVDIYKLITTDINDIEICFSMMVTKHKILSNQNFYLQLSTAGTVLLLQSTSTKHKFTQ